MKFEIAYSENYQSTAQFYERATEAEARALAKKLAEEGYRNDSGALVSCGDRVIAGYRNVHGRAICSNA